MALYYGNTRVCPIIKEESIGIPREVSASGVYQMPSSSFTFSLPSNVTELGIYALNYAFRNNTYLTSVDFSSLINMGVNAGSALQSAFLNCTNLVSVDLGNLIIMRGGYAAQSAFQGCINLTSVDLSSLTTVGVNSLASAFSGCTRLASIDLGSLTSILGFNGLGQAFQNCTSLASVDLSSLTTINTGAALNSIFRNCTSLTTLSFPALTSTSFGTVTNQFTNMLQGVTGCTVHFPSNLQSVIGSWSDVTAGFGGTNTTVLFDLPATT